jgi:excinuclease UvrABC nuclease subunit
VYMFVREDKAIYVGASHEVIGRALAANHHKIANLLEATSLILFPTTTYQQALNLEENLIADLQPIYNERGGLKRIAQIMGLSPRSLQATYKQNKFKRQNNLTTE